MARIQQYFVDKLVNIIATVRGVSLIRDMNEIVFHRVWSSFYQIYFTVLNSFITAPQYLSEGDFDDYVEKYSKEVTSGNKDCLLRKLITSNMHKRVNATFTRADICKLFQKMRFSLGICSRGSISVKLVLKQRKYQTYFYVQLTTHIQ